MSSTTTADDLTNAIPTIPRRIVPKVRKPIPNYVGQQLGTLLLTSRIGHGGHAQVYRAICQGTGTTVAVKILVGGNLSRFRSEFQILTYSEHENIVRPLHFSLTPYPYYTMEFLEGQTLRELLSSSKLSVPDALDILRQLCRGLHALHKVGIVHRDLKPSNIHVSTAGKVTIFDLGIAKKLPRFSEVRRHATDPSLKVLTDKILGSKGYIAPESIEPDKVSARTDIYALGVIFHEMITGHRYDSRTDHLGAVPDGIRRFILTAVDADPRHRFADALDVLSELDGLVETPADDTQEVATQQLPAKPAEPSTAIRVTREVARPLPAKPVSPAVAQPRGVVRNPAGAPQVTRIEVRQPLSEQNVVWFGLALVFSLTLFVLMWMAVRPAQTPVARFAATSVAPATTQPQPPRHSSEVPATVEAGEARPVPATVEVRPGPATVEAGEVQPVPRAAEVIEEPAKTKPRRRPKNSPKLKFRRALAAGLNTCGAPPQTVSYKVRAGGVKLSGPQLGSMTTRCVLRLLPTAGRFSGTFKHQ